MTPEEIESTVRQILSDWDIDNPVSPHLQRDVERVRALVLKALAQAAGLACGYCLNSLRVELRGEDYYHPAQSYWPGKRCDAGGIYALINHLSPEPVSS